MQVNGVGWGAPDVVDKFATTGPSDRGEAAAFDALGAWMKGDVLDLGVGGGRTTGLLLPHARSYVGVDLSPEMIASARARHPGADLRVGDAGDLTAFPDHRFDLVVFSYNGIDTLDHGPRLTALVGMARVLAPGGRLLFSSLNLDGVSYDERPWRVAGGLLSPRVRFHVAEAVRHPGVAVRSVRNFRSTRTLGQDGEGWAMRPMRAHEFRFVVHFATLGELAAEVTAAGLTLEAAYADDGRSLDPAAARTDADYVHLVCRRD